MGPGPVRSTTTNGNQTGHHRHVEADSALPPSSVSPSRQAWFIVNPVAGGLPSRAKLHDAIAVAAARFGFEPRVEYTTAPGHATQLAAEAEAAGAAFCIVVGGDGTLNEALNGIDTTDITMGLIPAGTANVWAKEAGIPKSPERALQVQFTAEALLVDVGRAGDRRFLLMASYGLDAAAVRLVGGRAKRWFGVFAYVVAGFRVGFRYPGFQLRITFDDAVPEVVDSTMIVVGNTRWYGSAARITSEASAVDAELDCVIFRRQGVWAALRMIPRVFRGRHLQSSGILFRRARRIQLNETDALPPMQVDGDPADPSAGEIRVEPGAVRIFVPNAAQPVFQPRN
ncbi:MAG TPA: diacylglycerol kinase family protein [Dehalococcoidia bacterium]|nr:diacylglycerol kinase family protein [Dehalococcoidia bacterium]